MVLCAQLIAVHGASAVVPGSRVLLFAFESDAEDFLGAAQAKVFTHPEGSFGAAHEPGLVIIDLAGDGAGPWSLAFQAPRGSELSPGVYEGATNAASPRKPAIDVSGEHRFCSFLKGRFVVLEAAYTDARVDRLAVDFEVRCENNDPIFSGYVRIGSDVPPPTTRTPTPTPRPEQFVLKFGRTPDRATTTVTAGTHRIKTEYYLYPWAEYRPHVRFLAVDSDKHTWELILASPVCGDLLPGAFEGATLFPWEALTSPGMTIQRNGQPGCELNGRFVIHEARYGEDGEIYRFTADFGLRCAYRPGALYGSVDFTSTRPTPTPAPPTPTPTDYSSLATLYSELGDFVGHCTSQYLTLSHGDFSAVRENERVTVFFEGGQNSWFFRFDAPAGSELVPGRYVVSSLDSGRESPHMIVGGQGRGCNATGEFTVIEAEYGGGNEVLRFAADFEQHCHDAEPALFGSVRYHSSLSAPTPVPTWTRTLGPGRGPCWGDCSGDGRVTVNELVLGVGLLLNHGSAEACRRLDRTADGTITVDELVEAVAVSLLGCDSAYPD